MSALEAALAATVARTTPEPPHAGPAAAAPAPDAAQQQTLHHPEHEEGAATDTASSARLIPVTVLSGFLGAGKTTLLQHILHDAHGYRIGVIVNDMSEVNIDAALVSRGQAALTRVEGKVIEMSNGCICCTLREDLLSTMIDMAREGKFDYFLIESSGISEPMPIAEVFTFANEAGVKLSDLARLDTTVSVVDGYNFLRDYGSLDTLKDRALEAHKQDERGVVDLLIDQVEFADVLVLNKVDLLTPAEVERLMGILRALNPGAKVLPTKFSAVPVTAIMNTGLFSMDKASMAAGWLQEIRGTHVPETLEYGISSFVYRARRPFHPQRLFELIAGAEELKSFQEWYASAQDAEASSEEDDDASSSGDSEGDDKDDDDDVDVDDDDDMSSAPDEGAASAAEEGASEGEEGEEEEQGGGGILEVVQGGVLDGVLRSKGFAWIAVAGGMSTMGVWEHAGRLVRFSEERWWAAMPEEEWPDKIKEQLRTSSDWDETWGDRRQELVFIGAGMNRAALEAALNAALLTEDEMQGGPDAWVDIPNPLPVGDVRVVFEEEEEEGEEGEEGGELTPDSAEEAEPITPRHAAARKSNQERRASAASHPTAPDTADTSKTVRRASVPKAHGVGAGAAAVSHEKNELPVRRRAHSTASGSGGGSGMQVDAPTVVPAAASAAKRARK